ncbi:hypothetical protein L596_017960 [Steinernema carpocapsae]|uniref:Uncharacterized protein n=1 Tax=Steinernema carpocapsae TaxID=34508 RepID=A0A4U5N3I4_STECR|nr:hypothetical protein L596_017960 [Steinernema carpocapsae]
MSFHAPRFFLLAFIGTAAVLVAAGDWPPNYLVNAWLDERIVYKVKFEDGDEITISGGFRRFKSFGEAKRKLIEDEKRCWCPFGYLVQQDERNITDAWKLTERNEFQKMMNETDCETKATALNVNIERQRKAQEEEKKENNQSALHPCFPILMVVGGIVAFICFLIAMGLLMCLCKSSSKDEPEVLPVYSVKVGGSQSFSSSRTSFTEH